MDWKLLGSTFAAIFIAELGDKTQLAALGMAAGSSSKWSVFLGCALALVLSSAIAVAAGEALGRYVSPIWLRRAAGVIFLVMGGLYLLPKAS